LFVRPNEEFVMPLWIQPALERGRQFAFPTVMVAVFAAGVGLRVPLPSLDLSSHFSFISVPERPVALATPPAFLAMAADPAALSFVSHELGDADEIARRGPREFAGGHGRFAAPGNALRRQIQVQAISPKTTDELAAAFRKAAYTLTDIRQGEAVPPLRLERVPADLVNRDGIERRTLFITALLPVILEANQRVLAEREHLLYLRDLMASDPTEVAPYERIWLEQLAQRYEVAVDNLDELLRRVDIVPPSMAIAQSGVETGWGTSFAARMGNALFGQIQVNGRHAVAVPWQPGPAMPQPFPSIGEAAYAYVMNLNTHFAYKHFRSERAAMRGRDEWPDGYRLIGTLLRYSELGQEYVRFVRQVMRENELADFDRSRLAGM
jgi:Bax protein